MDLKIGIMVLHQALFGFLVFRKLLDFERHSINALSGVAYRTGNVIPPLGCRYLVRKVLFCDFSHSGSFEAVERFQPQNDHGTSIQQRPARRLGLALHE